MIRQSLPRSVAVGACIAIGLAAWLLYAASGSLGIAVSDRNHAFTPADPAWSQALVPAVSVPHGWLPSSAIARASSAIARGRLSAIRDLATTVTVVTVVVFGILLIGAGLEPFPVLLATAGLAVSPTFWWRGVSWSPDTMAPLFALLAIWLVWRGLPEPPTLAKATVGRQASNLAAALACAAFAIAEDPSWFVLVPGAALWMRRCLHPGKRDMIVVAVVVVLALCAGLSLLDRWLVANALSGTAIAGVPVPDLWSVWRMSMMAVPPPSLEAFRQPLIAEFTVPGAALALVGAACFLEVTTQRVAAAVSIAGLVAWLLVMPRAAAEHVAVALALAGWTAVAMALTWLHGKTARWFGTPAIAVSGAVLILMPLMARVDRAYPPNAANDLEARAEAASRLPMRELEPEVTFVADTWRSDATLLRSARRAGRAMTIIPQRPDQLIAALSRQRLLAATPAAVANLETSGFLFERRYIGTEMVGMAAGYIPCADLRRGEWRDVLPQAAGGAIALQGAADGTRPGEVRIRLQGIAGNPVRRTSPARLRYLLPSPTPEETTLHVPQTRRGPPAIAITLTAKPWNALATVDSDVPTRVCGHMPADDLLVRASINDSRNIDMAAPLFRTGWYPVEADPNPFRWTGAERSLMVIGVAAPRAVRVSVTATPAARPDRQPSISLMVNECAFDRRPMQNGQADYEWDVEGRCWQAGGNRVWVSVTPLVSPPGPGDTRLLGARIGAVRITPIDGK